MINSASYFRVVFILFCIFAGTTFVSAQQDDEYPEIKKKPESTLYNSLSPASTTAGDVFVGDSLAEDLRSPSAEQLSEYADDADFIYDRTKPQTPTFWDRLRLWFWEKVFKFLFYREYQTERNLVLVTFIIAICIYGYTRLKGSDFAGAFFGRSTATDMNLGIEEENIHEMDFAALIRDAEKQQSFRRAVRLHYLQVLKQLTNRDLIRWRPEKTNHDYLNELSQATLQPAFRELTNTFEYVWYGNFNLNASEYEQRVQDFQAFLSQLERGSQ